MPKRPSLFPSFSEEIADFILILSPAFLGEERTLTEERRCTSSVKVTDMEDSENLLLGRWDGYSRLGWGQLSPLKVDEKCELKYRKCWWWKRK